MQLANTQVHPASPLEWKYVVQKATPPKGTQVENAICSTKIRKLLVASTIAALASEVCATVSTTYDILKPCEPTVQQLAKITGTTTIICGVGHLSLAIYMLCNNTPQKKVNTLIMFAVNELIIGLSALALSTSTNLGSNDDDCLNVTLDNQGNLSISNANLDNSGSLGDSWLGDVVENNG